MTVDRGALATLREELYARGLSPRPDELLSGHTSYRIGGPADLFVVVHTAGDMAVAIKSASDLDVPIFLLGGGTNILFGDRGFRGLVIQNSATVLKVDVEKERLPLSARLGLEEMLSVHLSVPSGVSLTPLSRRLASLGLGGLSWAEGIPGTVGGAIVNNAGAYGFSMSDVVTEVEWIEASGRAGTWGVDDVGFGYRTSYFRENPGRFVTAVHFQVTRQDAAYLVETGKDYLGRRKKNQPAGASAGSVFKNPVDGFAGRLIEESGLKGRRVGGASVSQKHANFIVNEGNASAADVRTLIEMIQTEVSQKLGVDLSLEIQLVGEF